MTGVMSIHKLSVILVWSATNCRVSTPMIHRSIVDFSKDAMFLSGQWFQWFPGWGVQKNALTMRGIIGWDDKWLVSICGIGENHQPAFLIAIWWCLQPYDFSSHMIKDPPKTSQNNQYILEWNLKQWLLWHWLNLETRFSVGLKHQCRMPVWCSKAQHRMAHLEESQGGAAEVRAGLVVSISSDDEVMLNQQWVGYG